MNSNDVNERKIVPRVSPRPIAIYTKWIVNDCSLSLVTDTIGYVMQELLDTETRYIEDMHSPVSLFSDSTRISASESQLTRNTG